VRWYGRVEGLIGPEEAQAIAPPKRRPRSAVRPPQPSRKLRP
jgi:hypothetical protein